MTGPAAALRAAGVAAILGLSLVACQPRSTPVEGAAHPAEASTAGLFEAKDLAYALPEGVDASLATLDLFRPDDDLARPLVVLVHGGSWVSGDKQGFSTAAPAFVPWWLARDYTVTAVNFRLASPLGAPQRVRPRDQASDIAHAIAWLLANAEEHHIQASEQVVLVGYSSGAHLVALLGADSTIAEAAGLTHSQLGATVSLDVHAYDVPYALSLMEGSVVERNIPLIRHLFGDTVEAQQEASPIAYLDGYVAPAMLVSVEASPEEPGSHGYIVHAAAEHYAEALRGAGHTASTVHDVDESHGTLATGFGEEGDRVTIAVGAFLDSL